MRVWIDQDYCTGDGLCQELCPDVFLLENDGLAYVTDGDLVLRDPGGHRSLLTVREELEDAVLEAKEECPGECIFTEE